MSNFKPWPWWEVWLFELRILDTIAHDYSIQLKRESWVEGGCDVIQSKNATGRWHNLFQGKHRQQHWQRIKHEPRTPLLHSKVATFVLMSWLDHVISSLDPTVFWTWPFLELSNGGQSYQEIVVQKVGLLIQTHGLKFGMVGTYNTYFWNIRRKGKVIFDHSTTLTLTHLYCSIFSLVEMICLKISERLLSWHVKFSLLVSVRGSKMLLA